MKTDSKKERKVFGQNGFGPNIFGSVTGGNAEIQAKMTILEYTFREILRSGNEKCEKKKIVVGLAISEYHFREILRFENEKCEKKKIVVVFGYFGVSFQRNSEI